MSEAVEAQADETPRFIRAMRALNDRRMAAMLLLSFAAGLPYGAVLGTLNAWLTTEDVKPSTIGILSIITLGYSFKYLWAPAFQTPKWIPFARLGARRSWLLMFQVPMAVLLALLALSDPAGGIGALALLALCIALMSATHDIILDAWRIEVARSDEDRDLMAALYQFGYRLSGFITGFVALLLAARFGWVSVYLIIAGMMLIAAIGTWIAPEPDNDLNQDLHRPSFFASLPDTVRRNATLSVSLGWLIAGGMILWFMNQALILDTNPSARNFVRNQGPIIVFLTVLLPALVAAYLLFAHKPTAQSEADRPTQQGVLRALFRAIFDPLMELVQRMRWGVILVLLLALTYRFTDAVWGAFAYPFYLDDRFGALHHTMDDVAIASKFFGVLMTIAGAGLGATVIAVIGRMPVLVVGALLAAATNLLFADLSAGGAAMDGFLAFTHLDTPLIAFAEWAATISPDPVAPDQGQRMARLMMAIAGENLAGGFASVAIVAYLTSVVNARFAAVQYALLGSLTMLLGTLGRSWLGEIIEIEGYYTVFIITFWLGMVAVALSAIEWLRQARFNKTDIEAA
ncbi:MAG: AmpG family muropeptide MFS transporter [Alphaproteobacteria bacterium]|nr:AmpG family muropeptide MFS transporter [Alphaproteobacteria bacterium]